MQGYEGKCDHGSYVANEMLYCPDCRKSPEELEPDLLIQELRSQLSEARAAINQRNGGMETGPTDQVSRKELLERIAELEAESQRLREALEYVRDWAPDYQP